MKTKDKYTAEFARRLRALMGAANISQAELARRIGLHESTMTGYYNGKSVPNGYTIAKMVEVLDVDANKLLGVKRRG